ncbi:ATP-binding protein [Alteriqipengyuania sp. NZ-12B]|uniref:ATP-binding protein n=1 Tax=Alteriqipengyuania abyssalis TaxID=2860200 RepID=A0ABS7PH18_9SPHN|nr:AAA family ATPase [Alteriqipengyuania abyssalis]MBY8337992.1 ATP-binding protein [Alteriqipengyuania abyssalis]
MELTKLRVERFKRIDEIEIPLKSVNILVGANGSGKSSILQAAHLASCLIRQVDRVRTTSTAMVRISDLDYLPSDEYWRLGHGVDWGNASSSPSSKVLFYFVDGKGDEVATECEMRSARNAGISVRGELPEEVRGLFRGQEVFFSGFIPGISGIPNVEQKKSKRVVLKACSFGDSNVYLRNALDLLSQADVRQIENWLEPLLGEVRLDIRFNELEDFEISANVTLNGQDHPLELLGTGYLQLIQIFCYILLFKPTVLLIDEPDIHLHPDVQERLPRLLLTIARTKNLKILLTTHSPFIVRGAPAEANVTWLAEGEVVTDDRSTVELALGWGAFGKKTHYCERR